MKKKNPAAVLLGTLGGKSRSEAKAKAAKENIKKRWGKITDKLKPNEKSNTGSG